MTVIKTRDAYVIEAHVPFDVDQQITCDENYNFPDNQLLLSGKVTHMKNLKGIFKQNAKSEVLQCNFNEDKLSFTGQYVNKFSYELSTSSLDHYGIYLCKDPNPATKYSIFLPLKHILAEIKVCEMVEGDF